MSACVMRYLQILFSFYDRPQCEGSLSNLFGGGGSHTAPSDGDLSHHPAYSGISSGNQSNSSPNTENSMIEESKENSSPGVRTPVGAHSGIQTPVYTEGSLNAHAHSVSWLVKLCVRNVLPHTSENGEHTEPLPVRLESLQVLAHLAKGYFPIIRCRIIFFSF